MKANKQPSHRTQAKQQPAREDQIKEVLKKLKEEEYRQTILLKEVNLLHRFDRYNIPQKPLAGSIDSLDETPALARNCSIVNSTLIQKREKFIEKIRHALQKEHLGTFGICEMCGEEIKIGRLMDKPWAAECIDCRQEYERQKSFIVSKGSNFKGRRQMRY